MPFGDLNFDELVTQLKSSEADERQLAAFELGQTESQAAVPHLISALTDSDLMVRVYAIQGLRDISDKSAVQPLCDILETNLDEPLVVSNVCRALGEIGDSASVPLLLTLLKNSDPFISGILKSRNTQSICSSSNIFSPS